MPSGRFLLLTLFGVLASCAEDRASGPQSPPAPHPDPSTPATTQPSRSVEFLLDRIDQAEIESRVLEQARMGTVRCRLSELPQELAGGGMVRLTLPYAVETDSFGVPLGVDVAGENGEPLSAVDPVVIPALRDVPASSHAVFAEFKTSRDHVGFRRVVLDRPGEVAIPLRPLDPAMRGTLVLHPGPGGIDAPMPEGHTEHPLYTAWVDGKEIGRVRMDHRGLHELVFEIPAERRRQEVVLRWEFLAPGSGATTSMLRNLVLTVADGRDRVAVPESVLAQKGVVSYSPAPPPAFRSAKASGRRSLTSAGVFLPGEASVMAEVLQPFEVLRDGVVVGAVNGKKKMEVVFREEQFGLGELTIRGRAGLRGEFWLIQPGALYLKPLPFVRGQEGEEPGHPLVRQVEIASETRRSMITVQGTRASFPLSYRANDRFEFSLGLEELGLSSWPRSELVFRVSLEGDTETPQILYEAGFGKAIRWQDVRVPMPRDSKPGSRLVLECRSKGRATLANTHLCLVVAEPRLVRKNVERPPNLLIYLIDTLRADHLSCYGYDRKTSPKIDRFAKDAILFEQAYSTSPWTRPSVASLFSGLRYGTHGAGKTTGLAPELNTLAERLRSQGFETAAFIANAHVHGSTLNFEQGFSRFVGVEKVKGASRASDVNELVFDWLEGHSDRPFFLYVHTIDPHATYEPPEETAGTFQAPYDGVLNPSLTHSRTLSSLESLGPKDIQYLRDLYDEEILFNDREFGRLMKQLKERGLYDNTVVVVVSDHGEEFHEHGGFGHGNRLWQELLRVPFLWKPAADSKLPRGVRVSVPASLIDVLPSVAPGLDLTLPEFSVQGLDLAPMARGEFSGERDILAEEEPNLRCLVRGPVKIIAWDDEDPDKRRLQLYDLASDPGEQSDLAAARPADAKRWYLELMGVFERERALGFAPASGMHQQAPTPEEIEALIELGYIAGDDLE